MNATSSGVPLPRAARAAHETCRTLTHPRARFKGERRRRTAITAKNAKDGGRIRATAGSRIVVTQGQIGVDPLDWFAGKLNHGNLIRQVRERWLAEAKTEADEKEDFWFPRLEQLGMFRVYYLDLGHISPGWNKMFSGGLLGLIEEARLSKPVSRRSASLSTNLRQRPP